MKLTYEMLEKLDACYDGLKWYKAQEPKTVSTVRKTILLALKSKDLNIVRYANWGIVQFLTKKQRIEYAIYAAEKVLHIFEEKFPDDQRPRLAVQAAKNYLNNPTNKNKLAAVISYNNVYAARVAARSAYARADAAWAAAWVAAYAAWSVWSVYTAAANTAARAALATGEDNRIKTLTDIVKFGLKLLKN